MKTTGAAVVTIAIITTCMGQDHSRPNLLLLVSDQTRPDALSGAGGNRTIAETPNLDRIAQEGVSFLHAFTATVGSSPTATVNTASIGRDTLHILNRRDTSTSVADLHAGSCWSHHRTKPVEAWHEGLREFRCAWTIFSVEGVTRDARQGGLLDRDCREEPLR